VRKSQQETRSVCWGISHTSPINNCLARFKVLLEEAVEQLSYQSEEDLEAALQEAFSTYERYVVVELWGAFELGMTAT